MLGAAVLRGGRGRGHPLIAWTCEDGVERLQGFRVSVRCVQATILSARFGAPTEQPVESMLWQLDSRDAQWPAKPFAEATRQTISTTMRRPATPVM